MYIGLHTKYPFSLSDFNGLGFYEHFFFNRSNIKFNENPSSGSPVVPYGHTHTHTHTQTLGRMEGQTDRYDEVPILFFVLFGTDINYPDNHHQHQGLDPLIRSVSIIQIMKHKFQGLYVK